MKIFLDHIKKSYSLDQKQEFLFQDLHGEVYFNQTLALLGPSGSGKTTLLKMIAGLEEPDEGTILINGEDLSKQDQRKKLNIGIVFQEPRLFPNYSLLENILLPLRVIKKESKDKSLLKVRRLLKKMNLLEHQDKKPAALSGGQAQRASIVRALALGAEFLLFDEPTASLDIKMKEEVIAVIKELAQLGVYTILVTHELRTAAACADHVLFLSSGNIIEQSPTKEFFSSPKTELLREFLSFSL